MGATWDVFVEGSSDKVFLQCLLKHLGISHVHTSVIRGEVSYLHKVRNEILRSNDSGNRIAIVLDADSNPQSKRIEFQKTRDKLKLPIMDNHCFLVPNDQDSGDLETLLEQIPVAEHRMVYDCFEQYESCLRNTSKSYRVPNRKMKIKAYCGVFGIATGPGERNYNDSRYWDLNASAIEPLKQFLLSLPR